MLVRTLLVAAVVTTLAALSAQAAQVEVETLDGQTVVGELSGWTADSLTLQAADGEQTIARDQLLALRPASPSEQEAAPPQVWVELIDGSELAAASFSAAAGTSEIELVGGQKLSTPTRSMVAVRFKEQDEKIAGQWEQIRRLKITGDVIVIRKKDAIDYLEGVLGDVTADKVHFELDGEMIPVSREKVEGILYYSAAGRELPPAVCIVRGPGATRVQAQDVTLAEETVELVSVTGVKLRFPLEAIEELDFSLGKIQYLSDLQPTLARWTPYFGIFEQLAAAQALFQPRSNRALAGGPLRLGGKSYRKGLALRSGSLLRYRLPDGYRRLTAVVGIDDRVAAGGAATLVIRGDDRELFTASLRGGEEPQTIDLDVSGVRTLTISTDYGADLDIADHVDLCDARISK